MFDTLQHHIKKLPGKSETSALCQIYVAIYSFNFHPHLTKTHLAFLFSKFRFLRDKTRKKIFISRNFPSILRFVKVLKSVSDQDFDNVCLLKNRWLLIFKIDSSYSSGGWQNRNPRQNFDTQTLNLVCSSSHTQNTLVSHAQAARMMRLLSSRVAVGSKCLHILDFSTNLECRDIQFSETRRRLLHLIIHKVSSYSVLNSYRTYLD